MVKRILYHYGSSHFNTGSPRALVGLIDLLDRSRFKPLLLPVEEGPLVDAVRARDVEVLDPGCARSISWRAIRPALRQLAYWSTRLTDERVDLLHLNAVGWNTDLVLAAWLNEVPVVLHVHNPVTIRLRNLNVSVADRIIMPSLNHQKAITGFQRIRSKCTVLYNNTTIPATGNGGRIREELKISGPAKVVLTVAQVAHGKGIDTVLEVAQQVWQTMPEVVFLIAGPDGVNEGPFADQVRAEARSMKDGSGVRFLGSRNDIPDLLDLTDVFFLPSRAEAFGIVFLEAMAAGVPVVATNVGGIPEVVAPPEGGLLVNDYEPRAFANALRRLLQDSQLRNEVSATAKARAERVFGHDQLSGTLMTTYDDLLSPHPRRSHIRKFIQRLLPSWDLQDSQTEHR